MQALMRRRCGFYVVGWLTRETDLLRRDIIFIAGNNGYGNGIYFFDNFT
jgi:hypothetical protein